MAKSEKESREDYLERILMLQEKGVDPVRAIDLAQSFHYSRPSVSIALKKLKADGYVKQGPHQALSLTPSGRKIAEATYERHRIIGAAFEALGVSEKTAYEDACRIEHYLSSETFEALKRHYELFAQKKENAGS